MSKLRFLFLVVAALFVMVLMRSGSDSKVQAKELAPQAHLSLPAIQAAGNNPADQLPAGPGRDTTVRLCTTCHGVSTFSQLRYSGDRWQSELDDMTAKGADMSDSEEGEILKYLTTYMGTTPAPAASPAPAQAPAPAPQNR